jgi:hypothetical protein
MYVNYCGSSRMQVIDRIRRAEIQCAGRRGYTMNFRQELLAAAG